MAGTLTLENQLRRALDESEFVLHYQPKVSLASGKVTGVEALIRWNDPRTGLVPPGKFIPHPGGNRPDPRGRALGAAPGARRLPALAGRGTAPPCASR